MLVSAPLVAAALIAAYISYGLRFPTANCGGEKGIDRELIFSAHVGPCLAVWPKDTDSRCAALTSHPPYNLCFKWRELQLCMHACCFYGTICSSSSVFSLCSAWIGELHRALLEATPPQALEFELTEKNSGLNLYLYPESVNRDHPSGLSPTSFDFRSCLAHIIRQLMSCRRCFG